MIQKEIVGKIPALTYCQYHLSITSNEDTFSESHKPTSVSPLLAWSFVGVLRGM